MIWHEASPGEGGEYYWRSNARAPIHTVAIHGPRGPFSPELAALLTPEFAHEICGQWSDRLPDPLSRAISEAETIPMRRRQF